MNYRHAFHAGNFADVLKHVLLVRCLLYLLRKPTPLRYIDTHAGIGRYDLAGAQAERTGEWRQGIAQLEAGPLPPDIAALLAPYRALIGPRDETGCPAAYPGSPAIAQALLRPEDRLTLCELHPDDVLALRAALGRDRRVKVLALDGFTGLKAFVPPPERRGLVLVDPPFERRDDFERMAATLAAAHRKWPTGTYLLWYPIKSPAAVEAFADGFRSGPIRRVLQVELLVSGPPVEGGPLAGCGLVIVNPPFGLREEAERLLPFLAERLGRAGRGASRVETLVGE